MRPRLLGPITILFIPAVLLAQAAVDFDKYFVDRTMRIDYFHIGHAKEEMISIDHIYEQGIWAGSKHNLLDHFNNGRYAVKVYDAQSGELIFSKGFDSYFGEYRTTDASLGGVSRTYQESALIPCPRDKIKFSIEVRDSQNRLQPLFIQACLYPLCSGH